MRQALIHAARRPLVVALVVLSAIPGVALAESAQDFVNKVAISDMFEIQSSQLALTKQPDADTKPFAEKMMSDHQKTSGELKALVSNGKVKATLPSALRFRASEDAGRTKTEEWQ